MLQTQRNCVCICKISLVLINILYKLFKRNKKLSLDIQFVTAYLLQVHIQTQCRNAMVFVRFVDAECGK